MVCAEEPARSQECLSLHCRENGQKRAVSEARTSVKITFRTSLRL
jgi:hypothetical protein